MIDKIEAWLGKLMNSLDPSVALHSASFMAYAGSILVLMVVWFIVDLVRHVEPTAWSNAMATMFLIAGGSHVLGSAVDRMGKKDGDQ